MKRLDHKRQFPEKKADRIVKQPITEAYVDRVMGMLQYGPDLLTNWQREHGCEEENCE